MALAWWSTDQIPWWGATLSGMPATEAIAVAGLVRDVRLHPRIAYQGLYAEDAARTALLDVLPAMRPFRGRYAGGLAVLDWDHRLPTRELVLRLYLYYDETSLAVGEEAFDDRLETIGAKDLFPEFDVPDFVDLPADEAYVIELGDDGAPASSRFTSRWRRDVDDVVAREAILIARASGEFAQLARETSGRARHLGDLDAVAWVAPCESGEATWTIDVWYLLAFDGRIGSGRSLLVDLAGKRVVTVRDFSVRAG